jgi:hypothetical protein
MDTFPNKKLHKSQKVSFHMQRRTLQKHLASLSSCRTRYAYSSKQRLSLVPSRTYIDKGTNSGDLSRMLRQVPALLSLNAHSLRLGMRHHHGAWVEQKKVLQALMSSSYICRIILSRTYHHAQPSSLNKTIPIVIW